MTGQHLPASPVRLRSALDGVPAYKPGRPPAVPAGVECHKMSSNENPYPPLPSVLRVVADAAAGMNRYPGMECAQLRERIAQQCGVSAEEIVPGAGSSGVLSQIIAATVGQDDEVVYAWRSFELYPILVSLAGAHSLQVALTAQGRHDLDQMAEAITPRTTLVLVCSPNNPTGPAVTDEELRRFLARVPGHVTVVIDEAYVEFVRDTAAADAVAAYRAHENVVVLRTFSKAYGLAGLRLGYAVAHPLFAQALRKTAMPFAVTELAQAAGVASLDARTELQERVEAIVAERERVTAGLIELGYAPPVSQANFVWLPLGARTAAFVEAAEERGLSVRPFAGEGARVSIDTPEANTRLLEVARDVRDTAGDGR